MRLERPMHSPVRGRVVINRMIVRAENDIAVPCDARTRLRNPSPDIHRESNRAVAIESVKITVFGSGVDGAVRIDSRRREDRSTGLIGPLYVARRSRCIRLTGVRRVHPKVHPLRRRCRRTNAPTTATEQNGGRAKHPDQRRNLYVHPQSNQPAETIKPFFVVYSGRLAVLPKSTIALTPSLSARPAAVTSFFPKSLPFL